MTVDDSAVQTQGTTESNAFFRQLLEDFRDDLERDLHAWLAGKQAELTAEAPAARELVSRLDQYVLRGGKRLRPALLYYSFRACGGHQRELVMPASLAVELLHTYLLIHDDIMDHAPTRRGEPTAHLVFRDEHRERAWHGDAEHHGESAAILLGDLAHCYADELFSRSTARLEDDAPGASGRIRDCYATMCQEVITGQYLEFTASQRHNLSEQDLLQILRMKSGRYSVERPIQLGALLARAPDSVLTGLSEFGLLLGEAFQLHDDLLGVFGEVSTVGKPVGGDLIEGKFTLLVHYALAAAGVEDSRWLRSALGRTDLTADEIVRATDLIRRTGAERRVIEMVEARHSQAATILGGLELDEEGQGFLAGVVDYLRERTQ
jgi:geranylgeranyl diphosphate synthase type I